MKLMPDGNLLTEITSNFSSAFISALQQLISISFLSLIEREAEQQQLDVAPKKPKQTDLSELVLHERGDMANTFGCRDVFDYIYAVLHSPTYRTRYADFLNQTSPAFHCRWSRRFSCAGAARSRTCRAASFG